MSETPKLLNVLYWLIATFFACVGGAYLFFVQPELFEWDWGEAPEDGKIDVILFHVWSSLIILMIPAFAIISAYKIRKRTSTFWLLAPFLSLGLLLLHPSFAYPTLGRF